MKKIFAAIARWITGMSKVWRREFSLVFKDPGVLLFFFGLPVLYPIVYTLIYNPEVVKEMAVVAVDKSATSESRAFLRKLDSTESIHIIGHAADLAEARRAMNEHECFGIIEVPADFSRRLGRSEQAVATFYSDMSLLLRYRQFSVALTDVQLATGAEIAQQSIDNAGLPGQMVGSLASPIKTDSVFIGDPTQGFASFIMPGLLVLIIQQSMVLGVTMLAGGHQERRRRNHGFDPLWVDASPSAIALGKTLCYMVIYLPILIYTLHIVPWMFKLPHVGSMWQAMLFMVPMLLASSMFAQMVSVFVTEREASMLVVVFTSIVFLFLSGLTWPRYAMNPLWTAVGDLVPATWGVEGFVHINSDNATLADEARPYHALWILAGAYFIFACFIQGWRNRSHRLAAAKASE